MSDIQNEQPAPKKSNYVKGRKDYTKYAWDYKPEGKSKHVRNLRRCIYESFLIKLDSDGVPYKTVGNTLKVIVENRMEIHPVEMTILFLNEQKTYEYNSKVNLYNTVVKNYKSILEQYAPVDDITDDEYIFTFGKYKDKNIKEIDDPKYLYWLIDQDIKAEVKKRICNFLGEDYKNYEKIPTPKVKEKDDREWHYTSTNSQGKKKFKRNTDESFEFVIDYLGKRGILDVFHNPRPAFIMFHLEQGDKVQYFWTTGRWAVMDSFTRNLPSKHYHSKGINDLFETYFDKGILDAVDQEP